MDISLNKKYDYLIVGAGFFGSICAYELSKRGYSCIVIDKRDHIGGNCFTSNREGINVHEYGPHIFHTSNEYVWKWINQFVEFNNFIFSPVANYKGEIYSLPFNMWTFSKLWKITTPKEAKSIIESQSSHIDKPKNLEEQAIKLVGLDTYQKLIKEYTEKQWKKSCVELPASIIKRLPVRFTYNNNYFEDKYQGIPIGGYTQIFNKLLEGIDIKLNFDYFKNELPEHDKIIYTGPIDKFYDYQFGRLEYKTNTFLHKKIITDDYQGCAVMNYTSKEVEYTRIIEHKHFEYNTQPYTWISLDYPTEYVPDKTDAMYPVNNEENNQIYQKYKQLSDQEKDVYFGGRLAEYKYYDMDKVIESALSFIESLNN
jgi:UDP-galactopyranose mutase